MDRIVISSQTSVQPSRSSISPACLANGYLTPLIELLSKLVGGFDHPQKISHRALNPSEKC